MRCEEKNGGTFEREPIRNHGDEENFPVFYRPDQEHNSNIVVEDEAELA